LQAQWLEQYVLVNPRFSILFISKAVFTTAFEHRAHETIARGKFIRFPPFSFDKERVISRSFNHSSFGSGDPVKPICLTIGDSRDVSPYKLSVIMSGKSLTRRGDNCKVFNW
jgi:hypothetical protein